MRLHGSAARLTIYIRENDQYHHRPLYAEIVHRAHKQGLAGATVLRGLEGFGASSHIHTGKLLSLSEHLPMAIVIVDTHAKITDFAIDLEALVPAGLIVLDEIEAYRRSPPTAIPPRADGGSSAERSLPRTLPAVRPADAVACRPLAWLRLAGSGEWRAVVPHAHVTGDLPWLWRMLTDVRDGAINARWPAGEPVPCASTLAIPIRYGGIQERAADSSGADLPVPCSRDHPATSRIKRSPGDRH
ncbi:DUF190 domain-containing protein [Actinomadura sp. B10D3]|uniref:DUF190 domain-containing protein n=1 Tax=Actinomadura sp. B10D3 TaxID=3153557 RepID=UPI00325DDC7A